ncbi:MAG: MBL fold metallo-hydrolase [Candidatus Korobacteraceae bacterium]
MSNDIMKAPESGVTVRMYRTGFGDCFLLAFRGRYNATVYMLIDCGVHAQYSGGPDKIREVVGHLKETTGGRLHVVAITHEHADHISGFASAREVFEKEMNIDQAWFAWTEDPQNPDAEALRNRRTSMKMALQGVQQRLAANGQADETIAGLLGFFGVNSGDGGLLPLNTSSVFDVIRKKAKDSKYYKPKCPPLTLPGVEGVRVFVLGPPEDKKALMSARPTGKPGEVYEEQGFAAASSTAQSPWEEEEASQPFASNYRVQVEVAKENKKLYPFFHEHYGFEDADAESWRRIDSDWLYPADTLALKLDSATNNTSLVLAIELQNSGRVLLFPGDAQVGNWESWHEGGWSEENGLAKGETITAKDLLNRTVLYKVGHHGSHNATLRELGLEMMVSKELTAMIPVNEEWALARKPYPWKMPFHPLYKDLQKRTRGRILRTDVKWEPTEEAEWKALSSQPREQDLYVELTIPDE